MSEKIKVNVDNFVRAQTHLYFSKILKATGEINAFAHLPVPWPIDKQIVIRTNRDTLYSLAIVDVSKGATVTLPDAGDRYHSLQVIDEDHYTNKVIRGSGKHHLTKEEFSTPYVILGSRFLVDPNDQADIKIGNELQQKLKIDAGSAKPFAMPDYDMDSFKKTYDAIIELGAGVPDTTGMFGKKEDVDPLRHLIGSAVGWGGLPEYEAFYEIVYPNLPVGKYQLTLKNVPCDAFWSITIYGPDGFMHKNDLDVYNINNISAKHNDDGSTTIHFGGCADGRVNCLPIMDGWNYIVRYYQPRKELLEGKFKAPPAKPVKSK
jgi:hypothetical protein